MGGGTVEAVEKGGGGVPLFDAVVPTNRLINRSIDQSFNDFVAN